MEINSEGNLEERKNDMDHSTAMFMVKLPHGGYINVNPEFIPKQPGPSTSGRFHVLYVDPKYGTCTFYVELKDRFDWLSYHHPPFIDQEFINWIGSQIEMHGQ